jgi:hypothetical protein
MGALSGQERCTARRTERQIDEAVLEGEPFLGQERMGLRHVAHRASVLLIVGHDDHDVGSGLRRRRRREQKQESSRKRGAHVDGSGFGKFREQPRQGSDLVPAGAFFDWFDCEIAEIRVEHGLALLGERRTAVIFSSHTATPSLRSRALRSECASDWPNGFMATISLPASRADSSSMRA